MGQNLSFSGLRYGVAVLVAAAIFVWAAQLNGAGQEGRALAFALSAGAVFGFVLQRSRFCFFCVTRDYFDRRDARGLLGIVAALAVGLIGYHAVFGAFLPIPGPGRLPAGAHIGPISWVLALGAFVFGVGMTLSGSCIGAHFYRLGEGATGSPFALVGALVGFVLGFLSWNALYLGTIYDAPVVWLPQHLGYGGSLLLQLAVLALVAAYLVNRHRSGVTTLHPDATSTLHPNATSTLKAGVASTTLPFNAAPTLQAGVASPPHVNSSAAAPPNVLALVFGARWPTYVGGLLIGALGVIAYFRSGPLGVTAELGSLARTAAASAALLPARLEGLDTFAGCATVVKAALFSNNGMFVMGLVLASFASAVAAGDFKPKRIGVPDALRKVLGGVLMGWGAMVSLGCTVGVLLSGIMAGALSGWLFAVFCFLGIWTSLKVANSRAATNKA